MNGADRIVAVLDHLQVPQAHVAGSSSLDWAGLLVAHAGRITGLTVPLPYMGAALPNDLSGISTPVHVLSGLEGAVAARAKKLAAMFPNGEFHGIAGYSSVIWSDICADHPGVMADLLTRNAADMPPASVPAGQGTHAGINYDVSGHGPALVLAPLALAPSQWDPVIETLATRFTVIRLSAPHLGLLVTLEDRARSGYGAMARDVFLRANPAPGAEVLEVGCGGGSVTRLLADVLPDHAQMTASDISPYLLREAQALGTRHARSGALTYIPADALALPFPDARFDIVCSFTVLEEADADVMLAEQLRVLRPGGHLVAVVRAVDHGWWLNLEGSDAEKEYWAGLGAKMGNSASEGGCADASLYARLRHLGLQLVCGGPRYGEYMSGLRLEALLQRLRTENAPEARARFDTAVENARAAGTFILSEPFHCAVARKPS